MTLFLKNPLFIKKGSQEFRAWSRVKFGFKTSLLADKIHQLLTPILFALHLQLKLTLP